MLTDMDLAKFGVYLSLFTGLRIGEVCALKWENISLSCADLEVRRTLQRVRSTDGGRKTEIVITEFKSLSEILGHANVNITLNRYVHSSFALKRKNMRKVEADMSLSPSNP